MDKRYQVFVSSTYEDLQEERREVMQALLELDCIPAGMELFPATNDDKWTLIKRYIDGCDYYIVIIGGRYGSIGADGQSYTQMEYEYAVSQNIPTIGFLHKDPSVIPVGKSEQNPDNRAKLEDFKKQVQDKSCKYWTNPSELGSVVSRSLVKLIKNEPAIGWVRADKIANESILAEINNLRQRNQQLEIEINSIQSQYANLNINNLAGLDEEMMLSGTYTGYGGKANWELVFTWKQIFAMIAPYLLSQPNDTSLKNSLEKSLFPFLETSTGILSVDLNDQQYQSIKIQLMALQLVNIRNLNTVQGGMALFWSLTKRGESLLFELRTIPSKGD